MVQGYLTQLFCVLKPQLFLVIHGSWAPASSIIQASDSKHVPVHLSPSPYRLDSYFDTIADSGLLLNVAMKVWTIFIDYLYKNQIGLSGVTLPPTLLSSCFTITLWSRMLVEQRHWAQPQHKSSSEKVIPCPVGTKVVVPADHEAEDHSPDRKEMRGGGLLGESAVEVSEFHPDSPGLMSICFLLQRRTRGVHTCYIRTSICCSYFHSKFYLWASLSR